MVKGHQSTSRDRISPGTKRVVNDEPTKHHARTDNVTDGRTDRHVPHDGIGRAYA